MYQNILNINILNFKSVAKFCILTGFITYRIVWELSLGFAFAGSTES